ncbi:MAG: sel1 repeat family protein [Muribaculaceae bacterium]|nr:sel1 repeat family protein [Muribaculaceae bacterium]
MGRRRIIPLLLAIGGVALAATPYGVREGVRALSHKAENGDAAAMYQLARLHDMGYDSIPVDTARSTALYRRSALLGYGPARNYLGFRYFRGEGVTQDVDSALYWLKLAAEEGDPGAANNLGYLYASGEYLERDYAKAREWFGKAAAAGLHTAEAQLADLYREGLGGEADTTAAIVLYNKAVEGGLRDARLKLVSLLRDAALKGDARAMAMLGEAYAKGDGVPYNHELATQYYLRAALKGDPSAALVIAELLDIFPDALTSDSMTAIIDEYAPEGISKSDLHSSAYWYEAAGGRR